MLIIIYNISKYLFFAVTNKIISSVISLNLFIYREMLLYQKIIIFINQIIKYIFLYLNNIYYNKR